MVPIGGTSWMLLLAAVAGCCCLVLALAVGRRMGPVAGAAWGGLLWSIVVIGLVYYFAPNVDPRNWKWITPGSIVGSILWLLLSGLFQLYVTYAAHYSKTYGTLATGVILLLWLNYSAMALLFGAELNSELDRQADIRAAGGQAIAVAMDVTRPETIAPACDAVERAFGGGGRSPGQ